MTGEERSSRARSVLSVIGSTVVMKGDLSVGEELVIEGRYDGTISARDTVTVCKSATINGEVSAIRVRVGKGVDLDNTVLAGLISMTDD